MDDRAKEKNHSNVGVKNVFAWVLFIIITLLCLRNEGVMYLPFAEAEVGSVRHR